MNTGTLFPIATLNDLGLIEIEGLEYDICIEHCSSKVIAGDVFISENCLVRMIGYRDGRKYGIDKFNCIFEIGPEFELLEGHIFNQESQLILYDSEYPIVVSNCLEDFGGLGVRPGDEVFLDKHGNSIIAGIKDDYLWLIKDDQIFCESIFDIDFCEPTTRNEILHRPAQDLNILYSVMKRKSSSRN